MSVNLNREENKENLDLWYGDERYRSKGAKEYIAFLMLLIDELLVYIAHVCRDIRELEGKR